MGNQKELTTVTEVNSGHRSGEKKSHNSTSFHGPESVEGGQKGGSPGEKRVGGVQEAREEEAGSGIPKGGGKWEK